VCRHIIFEILGDNSHYRIYQDIKNLAKNHWKISLSIYTSYINESMHVCVCKRETLGWSFENLRFRNFISFILS